MTTTDAIVREITSRAWKFGVAVLMRPASRVENGEILSGGYFDGEGRVLAVATGRDEEVWLGVMLHEYCHLTQWVEGQRSWSEYSDKFWDWLAGKPLKDVEKHLRRVQAVEEDCERRTIRLIQELDAPINLERYVRGANAYLHFHNTVLATRKWYRDDMSPIECPEVLAAANPKLDRDFTKTPRALRAALLKCV